MKHSAETRAQIYELGQRKPRLSNREIAALLFISDTSVLKFRDLKPSVVKATKVEAGEPGLHEAIRKALKKEGHTLEELANDLDMSNKRVMLAIDEMKARGSMIEYNHGVFSLTPAFAAPAGKSEIASSTQHGEFSHVFGFITDTHLCNKHQRLDVCEAAYDTFARLGITDVYHAGNFVDGEARFNKTELVTAPGMDSQLDYFIDKYPQRPGITTHYIAGDDHEGWYQQREGVEVGRYLQYRAQDQGRQDLRYLGYGEADVELKHGTGGAVMRVVHPGGGSSYAWSYTDQKRVESYQGGEKPSIELAGHYHKFNYSYPREVHCVQGGCTLDQTMFMRKKRLQAIVGYSVIKIAQDSNGAVTRFAPEFFPFFDRGYYRKDF